MPVMLPVVTPLVPLKAVPCRIHGNALFWTVKTRPSGPVQLLNVRFLMEPRLVPLIPWPLLSVPVEAEDAQLSTAPVLTSFRLVLPADAEMFPPGLMLKVMAPGRATPAVAPIVRAVAPPVSRILRVSRLRTPILCLSLIGLPAPPRRSGCLPIGHARPADRLPASTLPGRNMARKGQGCTNPDDLALGQRGREITV